MFYLKHNLIIVNFVMLILPSIHLTMSSRFRDIVRSKFFIDKTLLIETVLKDHYCKYLYIYREKGSGKTVNLQMLKNFFELQAKVNTNGKVIEKIQQTKNYKLFIENNLRITRNNKLMTYFGSYPIIWVNFSLDVSHENWNVTNQDCIRKIHEAFLRHSYLADSTKLSKNDKSLFREWFDEDAYKAINKSVLDDGLHLLSRLLFVHHNKKCIVLVDELDAFTSDGRVPKKCSPFKDFFSMIFRNLLYEKPMETSDSSKYVEKGIFMGRNLLPLMDIVYISPRPFSFKDTYIEKYGLTPMEVYDLFIRFNVTEEERDKVRKFTKVFSPLHIILYNISSIVEHLSRRKNDFKLEQKCE